MSTNEALATLNYIGLEQWLLKPFASNGLDPDGSKRALRDEAGESDNKRVVAGLLEGDDDMMHSKKRHFESLYSNKQGKLARTDAGDSSCNAHKPYHLSLSLSLSLTHSKNKHTLSVEVIISFPAKSDQKHTTTGLQQYVCTISQGSRVEPHKYLRLQNYFKNNTPPTTAVINRL